MNIAFEFTKKMKIKLTKAFIFYELDRSELCECLKSNDEEVLGM